MIICLASFKGLFKVSWDLEEHCLTKNDHNVGPTLIKQIHSVFCLCGLKERYFHNIYIEPGPSLYQRMWRSAILQLWLLINSNQKWPNSRGKSGKKTKHSDSQNLYRKHHILRFGSGDSWPERDTSLIMIIKDLIRPGSEDDICFCNVRP